MAAFLRLNILHKYTHHRLKKGTFVKTFILVSNGKGTEILFFKILNEFNIDCDQHKHIERVKRIYETSFFGISKNQAPPKKYIYLRHQKILFPLQIK